MKCVCMWCTHSILYSRKSMREEVVARSIIITTACQTRQEWVIYDTAVMSYCGQKKTRKETYFIKKSYFIFHYSPSTSCWSFVLDTLPLHAKYFISRAKSFKSRAACDQHHQGKKYGRYCQFSLQFLPKQSNLQENLLLFVTYRNVFLKTIG